jgi:hypothetical protein
MPTIKQFKPITVDTRTDTVCGNENAIGDREPAVVLTSAESAPVKFCSLSEVGKHLITIGALDSRLI